MEMLAKELVPSRTDKFLDSIAVCCGAVKEENDDDLADIAELQEDLKLWRIPTAETCDTETVDESMSHQPVTDEESIPSLDFRSRSIPSVILVEPEDGEEVQSDIRSQIFIHTIRRDENKEGIDEVPSVVHRMKLHVIQENVTTVGHKVKSVWIPLAKTQLESLEVKRHLAEWQLVAVVGHQKVKALWLQKKSVWIPLIKTRVATVGHNVKSVLNHQKAIWIPLVKSNMEKLRMTSVSQKAKFLMMQKKSLKKLRKIALKYNLLGEQRNKRLPRSSIMATMALQLKSKQNSSQKQSQTSRSECEDARQRKALSYCRQYLEKNSSVEEVEVNLVASNYVSIITRSLLPTALRPVVLNTLPIRTFEMDSC